MEKNTISYKKLEMWLEQGIDIENRIVEINDIDELAGNIVRAIKVMESESDDPIRIVINSFGGCVYEGLRIYDVLRESNCYIVTCGEGKVMSMGSIIFLAGDERYALPNTTFMLHEISSMVYGKVSEQKIEVEEAARLEKVCLGILADRTNKPAKWWEKETKHVDKYYTVAQAKKLGMITDDF